MLHYILFWTVIAHLGVTCSGESSFPSNNISEMETKLFACQLMEKFAVYRTRNLNDDVVCLQELSLFDSDSKIYILSNNESNEDYLPNTCFAVEMLRKLVAATKLQLEVRAKSTTRRTASSAAISSAKVSPTASQPTIRTTTTTTTTNHSDPEILPIAQARVSQNYPVSSYSLVPSPISTPTLPTQQAVCTEIPDGFTLFAGLFDNSNCFTVQLFFKNQSFGLVLTILSILGKFLDTRCAKRILKKFSTNQSVMTKCCCECICAVIKIHCMKPEKIHSNLEIQLQNVVATRPIVAQPVSQPVAQPVANPDISTQLQEFQNLFFSESIQPLLHEIRNYVAFPNYHPAPLHHSTFSHIRSESGLHIPNRH